MLYCCNGAFKSGSTWLYRIVQSLIGPGASLPEAFVSARWANPSISREEILPFLARVDLTRENYVVKTHYGDVEARDALLNAPHVRVFGISRDLRDVIVSAYYHYVRLDEVKGSFEDFFWTRGRRVARRVHGYNQIWTPPHPHLFQTTYEALQADFIGETGRLCEFLGLGSDRARLEKLLADTGFETQQDIERRQGASKTKPLFFRSGKCGDWASHFTAEMAAEVDSISARATGAV